MAHRVISTHILTKRMTHFLQNSRWRNCISTHILTKRMTTLTLQAQRLTKHFNSHPHEEDDGELIDFSTITDISTHILTKRMTIIRQIISWILNISTHILTKRMTTKETTLKTTNLFQLTSSRRGWQEGFQKQSNYRHFNSHPHEEDDCLP